MLSENTSLSLLFRSHRFKSFQISDNCTNCGLDVDRDPLVLGHLLLVFASTVLVLQK